MFLIDNNEHLDQLKNTCLIDQNKSNRYQKKTRNTILKKKVNYQESLIVLIAPARA